VICVTENPAVPTDDAAAWVKEVSQRQNRVREFLQRGGTVDFNIVLGAYVVADYIGRGEWSPLTVVEHIVLGAAVIGIAANLMRRRRNLGGHVALPTWIVAGGVFLGTLAVNIATSDGDNLGVAVWGAGLLALTIAYRKASLLVAGATLLTVGLGLGLGVHLYIWVPPLIVFNIVAIYLGREELFSQFRRAS
jgi:hypothetical protein